MPVRILCLHGMGCNAAIFESQTVGFRSLLPIDWEWHFIDGEQPTKAATGVDSIFPGPYLCFYDDPTPAAIQDTIDMIEEIIEEQGPFDGIMGFSQGGAVAASMILSRQFEKPYEPQPFRFAIFLSTSLPFAWNEHYGLDLREFMSTQHIVVSDLELWRKSSNTNLNIDRYRRFHATALKNRILIPSVHVYGAQDLARRQNQEMVKLCEADLSRVVEHSGGHEIPSAAIRDIAVAIQKTVARANFI